MVAVTQQGRDKVESVYDRHLQDVRRLVFDHLTDAQTEHLAEAMVAIASKLTEHRFLPGLGLGPDPASPESD